MSQMKSPAGDQLVWYVNFGSNLLRSRFDCYISGGKPDGSTRTFTGCRDDSMSRDTRSLEIPYSLYFAGNSRTWRHEGNDENRPSGRAYVGLRPGKDTTKARAYLITREQFEDVTAQENGIDMLDPIDLDELEKSGHLSAGIDAEPGRIIYDELVHCGRIDGLHAVSFTSSQRISPYTKPSKAYLRVMASGLMEAHGLRPEAVEAYLSTKPGVAGNWSKDELMALAEDLCSF